MAKLNLIRKLIKEDFDTKDQPLIEKLAFPINQFIEQVVQAFNKNVTISDNIPFDIKSFDVEVDADGIPIDTIAIKTSIKPKGIIVMQATQTNDVALTSGPFVQWTLNGNIITVTKVVGLPVGDSFNLTVLIIS